MICIVDRDIPRVTISIKRTDCARRDVESIVGAEVCNDIVISVRAELENIRLRGASECVIAFTAMERNIRASRRLDQIIACTAEDRDAVALVRNCVVAVAAVDRCIFAGIGDRVAPACTVNDSTRLRIFLCRHGIDDLDRIVANLKVNRSTCGVGQVDTPAIA